LSSFSSTSRVYFLVATLTKCLIVQLLRTNSMAVILFWRWTYVELFRSLTI